MIEIYSYGYSIPYLLFLLYYVVLMFLEFRYMKYEKDTKVIHWAAILGFVLFVGFRGFIYTDWLMYYPLFDELPTIWDGGVISVWNMDFSDKFVTDVSVGQTGVEMGFIYFTVLFKSIIPDYYSWIVFNTLLDILLISVFLKRYNKYYILAFICYLVFGGLIVEVNLMRNIKAILLFLISIKYLEERRIIPYFALNLLGLTFHNTAIIFLPLYFFLHKNAPKWLMWTIFIVGNIIFIMQIEYLKPILLSVAERMGGMTEVKVKVYFASELYSHRLGLGLEFFEHNIMFLLILLLKNKLLEQNPRNVIFINAYLLYFIFYFFFSEIMVAVERLTLLLIFSHWILIPEIFGLLKNSIQKIAFLVILIPYCFFKMTMMNSTVFARYDNVIFGIESFDERSTKVSNQLEHVLNPNQN